MGVGGEGVSGGDKESGAMNVKVRPFRTIVDYGPLDPSLAAEGRLSGTTYTLTLGSADRFAGPIATRSSKGLRLRAGLRRNDCVHAEAGGGNQGDVGRGEIAKAARPFLIIPPSYPETSGSGPSTSASHALRCRDATPETES